MTLKSGACNVCVKWNGEKFSDLLVDLAEPPLLLKAYLFSLTGVEPSNQKIFIKGKPLGNDNWGDVVLKDNMTLLMIGTPSSAVAIPPNTTEPENFEEEHFAKDPTGFPSGLLNLGNTCYLNSTLQCLRSIPELYSALLGTMNEAFQDSDRLLLQKLAKVYKELDTNDKANGLPVDASLFYKAFIEKFPQFAEKGQRGEPLQHDAEECWTLLTRLFEETLPKTNTEASLVDSYLKGEFTVRYENTECIKEVQSATSKFLFLKCLINNEVNHLEKGISLALRGTLEKKSAYLDRSCVFSYNSEISRLPGYLCVQFMRFYWKQSKAKKVKVVRNVKFPIELDLFEFCSADLREKLKEMRFKIKEFDDVVSKTKSSSQNNNKTPSLEYFPFSFETDPGSNNSGKYTLRAVLTHKGMYADGGHYVSWIRQALSDSWILYDDEKVSFKKQEDILKLSGGGEYHSAYLLLYSSLRLEKF